MYLLIGSWLVTVIGRPVVVNVNPVMVPSRYAIFPSAMLVLALLIALDGLPRGRVRAVSAAGLFALLVSAWWPRFIIPPARDLHWARYATQLQHKLDTGSRAPLTIPTNPLWSRPLKFDPVGISTEIDVKAETFVAGLGTHGGFSQSFVSRCDLLTSVEVRLAAQARSLQGALRMRFIDDAGSTIAEREVPRTELELDGSWHPLPFGPIEGSAGRRYILDLRAVGNIAEATIYVLGSRGNPYPDGDAIFGGRAIDADASIRYGCAPPQQPPP